MPSADPGGNETDPDSGFGPRLLIRCSYRPASRAGHGANAHVPGRGDWHEPVRRVIEATPADSIVWTEVRDRWPARVWTRERVALIGGAIHPMTPDLGQGGCQGIADAVTLATCVARASDLRAALTGDQRQRRRNAAITTMMARTMGATAQRRGRLTCTARNAIVAALPLPVMLRQLDLVVGRPQIGQPGPRHVS
jgi:2-polyprenyl-6-methoxyphenol hydroxylase-like FAD-dependent oxidoreductase